ncbi:MAG: carboxylating nicotinate-nucleotide diphosphorylase [Sphingobacteriales bacterium]|jgi:nicotinate-nucleotide pyrophosphorylase (carboxylating)|nr:carboxylating nicotinate-nucleotide diphosphorylase [Sphingobacteriales bacterium]MBP9140131.1 carboxylating nicotinate-nucleotide diphosphorylase [Chitinophagales bacterium]MDA0198245.1 carboxylating nicotinate-nucleotide diphosphorylase [Bacteroidota bacterium]MBK6889992.1 carboxylating nicotinate-nucleotide diphosphorylase [Sphingobacteriales bacterium]MBK7527484.1 carboxylating nicotinate-nucleotide diphosphorylase [Sphingobacteriales bacterium]
MLVSPDVLDKFIEQILAEDVREGDHTSNACIPEFAEGKARLLVKQSGILAGVAVAERIFHKVSPHLALQIYLLDGTPIEPGNIAFEVSGPIRSILLAERMVLNCMQRMSGVATLTNQYVKAIAGTKAKILDTRKTTPGIRFLEKWAVRIGGGYNHRFGLYDMLMIKDNHHDFCGGITKAVSAAQKYLTEKGLSHLKIELEVRNLTELEEALAVGQINRIMFDNFTPELTRQAVQMVNGRYETESSGGITLQTIAAYAQTGVDFISVGALTHSSQSLDLSLKAFT